MKTTSAALAAITLLACAAGCGEDEPVGSASGGAGGSGGSIDGGAGSSGSSGASGSSGSAGASGSAGSGGDAGTDAAKSKGTLLVGGTDFFSETEVTALALDTLTVTGRVSLADGDAVPAASGGRGFVLSRTTSDVISLDSAGNQDQKISVDRAALGETGTSPTNPIAISVVAPDQAWVFPYDSNRLARLDLAKGSVDTTLDLSSYLANSDGDGAVDADTPVFHQATGRLYFTLARTDRTTIVPPSFQLACPTETALLMALDVKTGTIADLNGAAPGEGLALTMANPVDMALDETSGRLLILSAGCFAGADGATVRQGYGVEEVVLQSLAVSPLLSPTSGDFLSRLLLLSSSEVVINRFDAAFSELWTTWSTASSSLGGDLSGVPGGAIVEDAQSLLGVQITMLDGGSSADVQRFNVSAESSTSLTTDPWLKNHGFVAGCALVR